MDDVIWDLRVDSAVKLIKEGKRIDGRALDEYRKIDIQNHISETAEGSAIVNLGKTRIVAGTKMILGTPYPDSQDQGTISVGAELFPIASPSFEFGPPKAAAIELSRVIDRGIRESKSIDFKDLCITEGEQVWIVFVDLYTMNDDGNFFDAGSIAALSAMLETKIPKVEDGKIVKKEYSGKLKLSKKPLLCTFAKIANKIVIDPTLVEEKAQDARFSVSTADDKHLCAFQKGEQGSFTRSEIDECIEIAFKRGKEIRKTL
ncbi:MAG: RNA-binding protein [Candidatus Diapherotrites archaeon]|uniref:RNA-binding protein n=1 Tax=Candidatus Iainarchaeum sp. TaxID=3101447 RepID=A0A2D6M1H0_9ARCH|nr:RNA-binding protein [Candidatus Diapherotrites archaeon]|tara:strand:+ start:6303 stop:7082 length:780 start_codon:yes stop_codon:yes gene_type:complete